MPDQYQYPYLYLYPPAILQKASAKRDSAVWHGKESGLGKRWKPGNQTELNDRRRERCLMGAFPVQAILTDPSMQTRRPRL